MSTDRSVELNIVSNAAGLPLVRAEVERLGRRLGFEGEDVHGLVLAIDEALANVIKHGYQGRENQPISVRLDLVTGADGRRGIAVQVRDRGRQVDPSAINARKLEDVRPGGLGVYIIRTVMDDYEYSCPEDGGMLLRMVKYVSQKPTKGKAGRMAARARKRR